MDLSPRLRSCVIAAVLPAILTLAACGHKAPVTVVNSDTSSGAAPAAGTAVLVPARTDFYGKLSPGLGTKTSKNGDTFTLTASDTFLHKNKPALEGAIVDGHVDNVQSAGPMKKPGMTIIFDDVRLSDGTKAPVNMVLVSMNRFEAKSHHLRTLGMMIGGAVAGHMAAGKHHGGLIGAAGGYALSQQLKTDIVVPAGSVIELRAASPITAPAHSSQ